MQQLMTLEVDIIIGQTRNQIKHLENKNEEEEDTGAGGAAGGGSQKRKKSASKRS